MFICFCFHISCIHNGWILVRVWICIYIYMYMHMSCCATLFITEHGPSFPAFEILGCWAWIFWMVWTCQTLLKTFGPEEVGCKLEKTQLWVFWWCWTCHAQLMHRRPHPFNTVWIRGSAGHWPWLFRSDEPLKNPKVTVNIGVQCVSQTVAHLQIWTLP